MTLREQVAAAALLGEAPAFQADGSALDPLVARLADRPGPQRTLAAIALVKTHEAAGPLPMPARPLPDACPPDTRPPCPAAAAGHLSEILSDAPVFLAEWLETANAAGVRPPEELVPALLDSASRERTMREAAAAAAGPLGVWLAQFRGEWRWVRESASGDGAWETGSLAERLALLRRVRAADPVRGRALVAEAWSAEAADVRRQFIWTLRERLGQEDEAFLETCLDDRSGAVRTAAAELLAVLPGSRLSERMFQRLAGRIRLQPHRAGSKEIADVIPFEELDSAMARDGIERQPPTGSKLGERAWWTAQAIGYVPPAKWCASMGSTPDRLLAAARNGDWADLLTGAWRTAAARQRDAEWLMLLADDAAPSTPEIIGIFDALEPAGRERCMLRLIRRDAKRWLIQAHVLCRHPWTTEFTNGMVEAMCAHRPQGRQDPINYQWKTFLRGAALSASTGASLPPPDKAFQDYIDIVNGRRMMKEALQNREDR